MVTGVFRSKSPRRLATCGGYVVDDGALLDGGNQAFFLIHNFLLRYYVITKLRYYGITKLLYDSFILSDFV